MPNYGPVTRTPVAHIDSVRDGERLFTINRVPCPGGPAYEFKTDLWLRRHDVVDLFRQLLQDEHILTEFSLQVEERPEFKKVFLDVLGVEETY